MNQTLSRPEPSSLGEDHPRPKGNRWLLVAAIVLGLVSVGLAVALANEASDDSAVTDLPPEVEQVLDDFSTAYATADSELMASIVTEDFFASEDFYSPGGTEPDFSFNAPKFSIVEGVDNSSAQPVAVERFGDPIVTGDGPWVVSIGETWLDAFNRHDGTATYLIVNDDGVVRIHTYDWAGIEVPVEADFDN